MKGKFRFLTILLAATMAFSSCDDDEEFDEYTQWQEEVAAIDQYLEDNNIDAIKDASGIRIHVETLGTGLPAYVHNTVDVDYVGTLFSNGTQFDAGNTVQKLSGYINGWQFAFQLLPAGTVADLYIPSFHAYGRSTVGSIPANSTLKFRVTFNEVVYNTTEKSKFTSDTTAINAYLNEHEVTAVTDESGVRYELLQEGSGDTPGWFDAVKLRYSVTLMSNGTIVVANTLLEPKPSEGFASRVVDYIHGVKVGARMLKEGGKVRLYIPSALAYGNVDVRNSSGAVVIPANANIIVDLELVEVLE